MERRGLRQRVSIPRAREIAMFLAISCFSTTLVLGAQKIVIYEDFDDGSIAGTIVGDAMVQDYGDGRGPLLSLTQVANGQRGYVWFEEAFDLENHRLVIDFEFYIRSGTSPTPAEGLSVIMQFGGNLNLMGGWGGLGTCFDSPVPYVSVAFDIWDNEEVAADIDPDDTPCSGPNNRSCHVEVNQSTCPGMTHSVMTNVDFGVDAPDFVAIGDEGIPIRATIAVEQNLLSVYLQSDGDPVFEAAPVQVIGVPLEDLPGGEAILGLAGSTLNSNAHHEVDNIIVVTERLQLRPLNGGFEQAEPDAMPRGWEAQREALDESGPFCTIVGDGEFLFVTDEAQYLGQRSLKVGLTVTCGPQQNGWREYRKYAMTHVPVLPTSDYVTVWLRPVDPQPYTCEQGDNYDARNIIEMVFSMAPSGERTFDRLAYHGTEINACSAHVDPEHFLNETYDEASEGRDGETWYRYTRRIPSNLRDSPLRIGVGVRHFQNWTSTGGTVVYFDDIFFSDAGGNPARPPLEVHAQKFLRGETNNDGTVDIADAIWLLSYLFNQGPPPACLDMGDANDDGNVDIADAIFLLAYLFAGGPTPPAPFFQPGEDPTQDLIDCIEYVDPYAREISPDEHFSQAAYLEQTMASFLAQVVSSTTTQKDLVGDLTNTVSRLTLRSPSKAEDMRNEMIAEAEAAGALVGLVRFRGRVFVVTSFLQGGDRFIHLQTDLVGGSYQTVRWGTFELPRMDTGSEFFSMTIGPDEAGLWMALRDAMPDVIESIEDIPVLTFEEDPEDGLPWPVLNGQRLEPPPEMFKGQKGMFDWAKKKFKEATDALEKTANEAMDLIVNLTLGAVDILTHLPELIALLHGDDSLLDLFGQVRETLTCATEGLEALTDAFGSLEAFDNPCRQDCRKLCTDQYDREVDVCQVRCGPGTPSCSACTALAATERDRCLGQCAEATPHPLHVMQDFADFSLIENLTQVDLDSCVGLKEAVNKVAFQFMLRWQQSAGALDDLAALFWGGKGRVSLPARLGNSKISLAKNASITVEIWRNGGVDASFDFTYGGVHWGTSLDEMEDNAARWISQLSGVDIDFDAFADEVEQTANMLTGPLAGYTLVLKLEYMTDKDKLQATFTLKKNSKTVWIMSIYGTTEPSGGLEVIYNHPSDPCIGATLNFEYQPEKELSCPFDVSMELRCRYRGQCFTVNSVFPPQQTVAVYAIINVSASAHAGVGGGATGGIGLYLALPLDKVLAECWDGYGRTCTIRGSLNTVMNDGVREALEKMRLQELIERAIRHAILDCGIVEILPTDPDHDVLSVVLKRPKDLSCFLAAVVDFIRAPDLDQAPELLDFTRCVKAKARENLVLGVQVFLTGGVGVGAGMEAIEAFADLIGTGSAFFEMPLDLWLEFLSFYTEQGGEYAFLAQDLFDWSPIEVCGDNNGNGVPDWVETRPSLESLLQLSHSVQWFVRQAASDSEDLVDRFAQEASVGAALGLGIEAQAQNVIGIDTTATISGELALNGEFVLNAMRPVWAQLWDKDVARQTLVELVDLLDTPARPQLTFRMPIQVGVTVGVSAVLGVGCGAFGRLDFLEGRVPLSSQEISITPRVVVIPEADSLIVEVGQPITFSGTAYLYEDLSVPPDENARTPVEVYRWDLGDGNSFEDVGAPASATTTHAYSTAGVYAPILTAQDECEIMGRDGLVVVVCEGSVDPDIGPNYDSQDTVYTLIARINDCVPLNLGRATSLTLTKGNETITAIIDDAASSQTALAFTCNLAGAVAGSWSIEVEFNDGQLVSFSNIFTVKGEAYLAETPWPMLSHDLGHTSCSTEQGPLTLTKATSSINSTIFSPDEISNRSFPVLSQNRLYIGSKSSRLKAASTVDYTSRGSFYTNGAVETSPALVEMGTGELLICVATAEGRLHAITDKDDGWTLEEEWTFSPDLIRGYRLSSPAVSPSGIVYFGSENGQLYGIDTLGNETLHVAHFPQDPVSSPAIREYPEGFTLYYTVGNILYTRKEDGSCQCGTFFSQGENETEVVLGEGNRIFWGASGVLYALTDNGSAVSESWSWSGGSGSLCRYPALSGSTMYVGRGTMVYAVVDTGHSPQVKWNYDVTSTVTGVAADSSGLVYVNTWDHGIFLLRDEETRATLVDHGIADTAGGEPLFMGPPVLGHGVAHVVGFKELDDGIGFREMFWRFR